MKICVNDGVNNHEHLQNSILLLLNQLQLHFFAYLGSLEKISLQVIFIEVFQIYSMELPFKCWTR